MARLHVEGQQLHIIGQVNYQNATLIDQQGQKLLANQTVWPIQVNLSQVEQGNTLLLAIIIQWLRKCPTMESLSLRQVPEKMLGIIRASHLDHLVLT